MSYGTGAYGDGTYGTPVAAPTGTVTISLGPLTTVILTANLATIPLGPLTVISHGTPSGGGTLAHMTSTKPRVRI